MRHDLTSGAWVEMRPVQDLKVRDREVYEAPLMDFEIGMGDDGKPDLGAHKFSLKMPTVQRRALLCRLLTGWSYDLVIPTWAAGIENEDSFLELPIDDWDEIAVLLQPYIRKVSEKPDPKGARSGTSTSSSTSSTTRGRESSRPD